jgi:short-subunit dehydrogenase
MDQKKQVLNKNSYALVTGSGQGIGFAFAEALAKKGYNLVMVSLEGEGLPVTASALAEKYSITVVPVELDLCNADNCGRLYNIVKEKGLQVSVLINNAGIGSNAPFTDFDPVFYHKQITLNTIVPVTLCRLVLPDMEKLPEAYILNMASMGAFFHMPHKEVYVATKSFLISFTRSLQFSLAKTSVSMTVLCPGSVNSNNRLKAIHADMKGIARRSVLDPHEVAEEGLNALFRRKKIWVPGRVNRFLLQLNRIMPIQIKNAIIRREMDRQEALKIPLPKRLV